MDAELERLRRDALAALPTMLDVAIRVRSVAWWPGGSDPARPRVAVTPRPRTPEPGDTDLVTAYRVMTQELARAHAWLYTIPPTVWQPSRVLFSDADQLRPLPADLVRDVPADELAAVVGVLTVKLRHIHHAAIHPQYVRGAVDAVLAAWEAYPPDVRRPPDGRPVKACECGCGRLVGDRRGRLAQVCANRRSRHRRRAAA